MERLVHDGLRLWTREIIRSLEKFLRATGLIPKSAELQFAWQLRLVDE